MSIPSATGFPVYIDFRVVLRAGVCSSLGNKVVRDCVGDVATPEGCLRNAGNAGLTVPHLSVSGARSGLPAHVALAHQAVDKLGGEPHRLKVSRPCSGGWGVPLRGCRPSSLGLPDVAV